MRNLGVELMTVFGLPPIQFVELVAELGVRHISAVLEPLQYNPEGYSRYSLRSDTRLRRDMIAAMATNGVSIALGEGFVVRAEGSRPADDPFVPGDGNMRDSWAADLDTMAELGVKLVNAVCVDADLNRGFDQLGVFAELAAERGMRSTIEFCPGLGVGDLPTAVRAVEQVGRRDFRLLMDPMHLIRSGGSPADIAALDPQLIAYSQLCDVPLVATNPDYLDEAMNERLTPGMGELPLLEYLEALPRDLPISLEVPQRPLAEQGIGPRQRVEPILAGARALLAQLELRNRPQTRYEQQDG
jgi:sugar phosphate isomerase/epimerase